jgi:hypothetical protein
LRDQRGKTHIFQRRKETRKDSSALVLIFVPYFSALQLRMLLFLLIYQQDGEHISLAFLPSSSRAFSSVLLFLLSSTIHTFVMFYRYLQTNTADDTNHIPFLSSILHINGGRRSRHGHLHSFHHLMQQRLLLLLALSSASSSPLPSFPSSCPLGSVQNVIGAAMQRRKGRRG